MRRKVHEAGNEYFHSVADSLMNHWDNILNFFNNRSTNAHAESLNAQIKLFRANLEGLMTLNTSSTDHKKYLLKLGLSQEKSPDPEKSADPLIEHTNKKNAIKDGV